MRVDRQPGCGAIVAAGGALSVTGAALPAGPGNTLSYAVPVVFAPELTANPLVNTASANAGSAASAASDSNVRMGPAPAAVAAIPVNGRDGGRVCGVAVAASGPLAPTRRCAGDSTR